MIDGFGTYDDETQASPVFSHIGARGYFVSDRFRMIQKAARCPGPDVEGTSLQLD